ncbi:uncharacterized [Tachysurus ichikawai]
MWLRERARVLSPIACLARHSEHNPVTQGELLISQERDVLGSAGFTRGQARNDGRGLLRTGFFAGLWIK